MTAATCGTERPAPVENCSRFRLQATFRRSGPIATCPTVVIDADIDGRGRGRIARASGPRDATRGHAAPPGFFQVPI
jgi:hypothetical protein